MRVQEQEYSAVLTKPTLPGVTRQKPTPVTAAALMLVVTGHALTAAHTERRLVATPSEVYESFVAVSIVKR